MNHAGMKIGRRRSGMIASAAVALLLAAGCGGGGGGDIDATGPGSGSDTGTTTAPDAGTAGSLPPEAMASMASFKAWMLGWVQRADDDALPLSLGEAALPADDDAAPSAL